MQHPDLATSISCAEMGCDRAGVPTDRLHMNARPLMRSRACAILSLVVIAGCHAPATAPETSPPQATPLPTTRAPAPATAPVPPASSIVQLGAISVDRTAGLVRVPGVVVLREGWLEQAVCQQGTRDHESLITVSMPPSSIHAALLLAGLTPGRPGHWRVREDGSLELLPPTGDAVRVDIEWIDAAGGVQYGPIGAWIKTSGADEPVAFVFAGGVMRDRAAAPYVADQSGSVVGLVTFGDEPIASVAVVPDRVDVAEPSLQAWSERIPPEGTAVTVVIRRAAPPAP